MLTNTINFQMAEQCNNIDLYFCGIRLALPLLAFANALNYVNLFTATLRYWDEACEMEKAIITQYCFTMKTTTNANIGMDFSHERYICLRRDITRKVCSHGLMMQLEYAGLCCINDQKKRV